MNIVPILRGDVMTECVFIIVAGNFRIARGSRSEEHKHRVCAAGRLLGPRKVAAEHCVFIFKAVPALTLSADKDFYLQVAVACRSSVNVVGRIIVRRADYRLDMGSFEAVFKVVLKKLMGSRDCYCAELMERKNGEPELIVPLENHHNLVALFDAEALEVVCRPCRAVLHVPESEAALGLVLGNMEHCKLVRALCGNSVNNVIGKVELVLVFKIH